MSEVGRTEKTPGGDSRETKMITKGNCNLYGSERVRCLFRRWLGRRRVITVSDSGIEGDETVCV